MSEKRNHSTVKSFNLARDQAIKIIEDFSNHYPLDIFPEPNEESGRDLWGAKMARHVCKILVSDISKLKIKRDI